MSRRQAREFALQVLFQVDIGKARPEAAMEYAAREKSLNQEDLAFARKIIQGTLEYLEPIDRVISRVSHDWELNRMAAVDRNIIRLALFEIFYCADIPLAVSVDEAVELAKAYGTDDSSRFINGILGKVVKDPASYLKS
ncbi:MAG: transcription antitermination factor NusB [Bacillota bacterium]